jgi:hypothetical protein
MGVPEYTDRNLLPELMGELMGVPELPSLNFTELRVNGCPEIGPEIGNSGIPELAAGRQRPGLRMTNAREPDSRGRAFAQNVSAETE